LWLAFKKVGNDLSQKLGTKLFTRIKDEDERRLIREFIAS
jgi:hypothetical protein